jgi:hypothetical protein
VRFVEALKNIYGGYFMNIGEKYKIESDRLNVIVLEFKPKATDIEIELRGKGRARETEKWQQIGYFPTPKDALSFLVNKEVKETHLTDLKTIVDKIDSLETLIQSLNIEASGIPKIETRGRKPKDVVD